MTVLRWLYDSLIESLVGATLGVIVLLTATQVVARYVLGDPLNWIEEFARLLLVWAVMFGAAAAVKRGSHLAIDLVLDSLPRTLRVAAILAIQALTLLLAIGMIRYGFEFYDETSGDYATSLGFARNLFYLPIPISGLLIAAAIVPATIFALRDQRTPPDPGSEVPARDLL